MILNHIDIEKTIVKDHKVFNIRCYVFFDSMEWRDQYMVRTEDVDYAILVAEHKFMMYIMSYMAQDNYEDLKEYWKVRLTYHRK